MLSTFHGCLLKNKQFVSDYNFIQTVLLINIGEKQNKPIVTVYLFIGKTIFHTCAGQCSRWRLKQITPIDYMIQANDEMLDILQ